MKVIRHEVEITMVLDRTNESAEWRWVAKCAFLDLVEDFGEVWVDDMRAVGVSMAEVLNVFG
jgi:hypothetical protein